MKGFYVVWYTARNYSPLPRVLLGGPSEGTSQPLSVLPGKYVSSGIKKQSFLVYEFISQ